MALHRKKYSLAAIWRVVCNRDKNGSKVTSEEAITGVKEGRTYQVGLRGRW